MIELTIVVLAMAILTTVGVTRVSARLNSHAVDGVARLLIADLVNARQEALTTSASVTVVASRTANNYSVSAMRSGVATVIRSATMSNDPWKCSLSSLLVGVARTAATTASVTVNGAGVFSGDLVFGITRGEITTTVRIEASTGRVIRE